MFKDLVTKSRSYRGFDENKIVTRDELVELVDCARLTPATANIQPLKYYLAHDKDEVEAILALTTWAGALPELNLPNEGEHPSAFIIICQDMEIGKSETTFLKDVGIVAQTIALAAADRDLATCMIGNFSSEKLSQLIHLDSPIKPQLVVAFGKGTEKIEIVEIEADESTKYYRDSAGIHYVPKRKLKDILL